MDTHTGEKHDGTIKEIMDDMRLGAPTGDVPMDYINITRDDYRKQLGRIVDAYVDAKVEKAKEKAQREARERISHHVNEASLIVSDEDKLKKLTILYGCKFKNKLSLVGFKRFVVKNKDLSPSEIDTLFNKHWNWIDMDISTMGGNQ